MLKEFNSVNKLSKHTKNSSSISSGCAAISDNKTHIAGLLSEIKVGVPIPGKAAYCGSDDFVSDQIEYNPLQLLEVASKITTDIDQINTLISDVNTEIRNNQIQIMNNEARISVLELVPQYIYSTDPKTGELVAKPNEPQYSNAQRDIKTLQAENAALEADNVALAQLNETLKGMEADREVALSSVNNLLEKMGEKDAENKSLFGDDLEGRDLSDTSRMCPEAKEAYEKYVLGYPGFLDPNRVAFLQEAFELVGTGVQYKMDPTLRGTTDANGNLMLDCSSYVGYAMNLAGIPVYDEMGPITPDSKTGIAAVYCQSMTNQGVKGGVFEDLSIGPGSKIDVNSLMPGDLLLYGRGFNNNHVVIFLGTEEVNGKTQYKIMDCSSQNTQKGKEYGSIYIKNTNQASITGNYSSRRFWVHLRYSGFNDNIEYVQV